MSQKIAIHCKTEQEWRDVQLKRWGKMEMDFSPPYKEEQCINIEGNAMQCNKKFYENEGYTIIPASEYLNKRKFKVGDRVMIVNSLRRDSSIHEEYRNQIGKESTIERIVDNPTYPYVLKDIPALWKDDELELVNNNLTPNGELETLESPFYDLPSDWRSYYGVDWWGFQDKPKGKIMSVIKNAFKSKQAKALSHYGITNGDGGLTETGRQEFVDYLYETMTAEKKAFIAKVVEEYEEEDK